MGKIIPVLMLIVGVAVGVGVGIFLKPDSAQTSHGENSDPDTPSGEEIVENAPTDTSVEYVKMNNQFVVPVVDDSKVKALVVLSLSLEVIAGGKEETFQREPKLRSAFNQVLFDHANAGGFDGVFTNANNMIILEDALYEVAVKTMGDIVRDVLIDSIVRQDY